LSYVERSWRPPTRHDPHDLLAMPNTGLAMIWRLLGRAGSAKTQAGMSDPTIWRAWAIHAPHHRDAPAPNDVFPTDDCAAKPP